MADRSPFAAPLRLLGQAADAPRAARSAGSSSSASARTPPLLDEPSLFYDPPYDDPVHDAFAWHLVKYLQPGSGLRHHVEGPAVEGCAGRIDFVVEQNRWRVGFMCGVSEAGAAHDRQWDALCIGQAAVDVLYRLRAGDIEQHLHDALLLVGKWDAALFSERGRINLNTLATPAARAARPGPTDTVVTVAYDEAAGAPGTNTLCIQRLSRSHPEGWMPAYRLIQQTAGPAAAPRRPWARSA